MLFISSSLHSQLKTVVIDPGHGGKDVALEHPDAPGAPGVFSLEKDINLAVSLKLGAIIEEWYPYVNVVYTRKTDIGVFLSERSAISNTNNADLFISIHANADKTKSARGSETYILGLDKLQDNFAVVMRENSAILAEDDYETKYEGFDNSPESYIIFNLIQNIYMENSLKMAEFIQEEFQNGPITHDRGVKQGPFLVLRETACPSVLIELGFISNPEEEKILNDPTSQQEMVECIFKAFKRYKEYIDEKTLDKNL